MQQDQAVENTPVVKQNIFERIVALLSKRQPTSPTAGPTTKKHSNKDELSDRPHVKTRISSHKGCPIDAAVIRSTLAPLFGEESLDETSNVWKMLVRNAGVRTFSLEHIYHLDIDSARDDCIHICAKNTFCTLNEKSKSWVERIDGFAFGSNFRCYGIKRGIGITEFTCTLANLDMPVLPAEGGYNEKQLELC
jgi:hypothetical protein